MDTLIAIFTADFWEEILPWCGVVVLTVQSVFALTDRDHFSGFGMIARHAELSCRKTGYVAAFMARNGIVVSLALFVIGGLSGLELEEPYSRVRLAALIFVSTHLVFHAVLVFLVAGAILRFHQKS